MRVHTWSIAFGIVGFCASAAGAFENEPKPLGLEFGLSESAVIERGVIVVERVSDNDGVTLVVENTPKSVSGMETTVLAFGHDDELYQVLQVSREFADDKRGSMALSRMGELIELLDNAYGPSDEIRRTPSSDFMRQDDNFAYSIYKNERSYVNRWESEKYQINLMVRSNMEDTFLMLGYEDKERQERASTGSADIDADAL